MNVDHFVDLGYVKPSNGLMHLFYTQQYNLSAFFSCIVFYILVFFTSVCNFAVFWGVSTFTIFVSIICGLVSLTPFAIFCFGIARKIGSRCLLTLCFLHPFVCCLSDSILYSISCLWGCCLSSYSLHLRAFHALLYGCSVLIIWVPQISIFLIVYSLYLLVCDISM